MAYWLGVKVGNPPRRSFFSCGNETAPVGGLCVVTTNRGTELGCGELDLSIAVQALKDANYNGVWTIEYEKKDGDRVEGARKSIAHLKSLL